MALASDEQSAAAISPGLGLLLTRMADTSDIDTALRKVLDDYLRLKIADLKGRIQVLEDRWRMSFAEFSVACEQGALEKNAYSYSVESDFWEWEEAETLLEQYSTLREQWM
jgi:hypothetical protein